MILSIDVETGGIDPLKHSLLEFAAVNVDNMQYFRGDAEATALLYFAMKNKIIKLVTIV